MGVQQFICSPLRCLFLREDFTMLLRLSWNSLCSPGWPWTHNPPLPPKCWNYRHVPPYLDTTEIFKLFASIQKWQILHWKTGFGLQKNGRLGATGSDSPNGNSGGAWIAAGFFEWGMGILVTAEFSWPPVWPLRFWWARRPRFILLTGQRADGFHLHHFLDPGSVFFLPCPVSQETPLADCISQASLVASQVLL